RSIGERYGASSSWFLGATTFESGRDSPISLCAPCERRYASGELWLALTTCFAWRRPVYRRRPDLPLRSPTTETSRATCLAEQRGDPSDERSDQHPLGRVPDPPARQPVVSRRSVLAVGHQLVTGGATASATL